jgi:transcriptional regulator GlxA family with amidase domain
VVEQGKENTAAGVTAGIDMALTLAERIACADIAQAIQLAIEYDPEPPFDSGSPRKASDRVLELVRGAEAAEHAQART